LRATPEPSGAWRIAIDDMGQVEEVLLRLREAGCALASLEVGEPELEEVFVKIMRAHAA
jgi:ABC-2 type transport system ATP-binding protein